MTVDLPKLRADCKVRPGRQAGVSRQGGAEVASKTETWWDARSCGGARHWLSAGHCKPPRVAGVLGSGERHSQSQKAVQKRLLWGIPW